MGPKHTRTRNLHLALPFECRTGINFIKVLFAKLVCFIINSFWISEQQNASRCPYAKVILNTVMTTAGDLVNRDRLSLI